MDTTCNYSKADTNIDFCSIPPFVCEVDRSFHESLEALNKHLRKFKIKQKDYYENYYKRVDLLTGEPIVFKSIDQYFSAHFKDKNNMKRWFKENPEDAKKLSIRMLKERIKRKSLTRLPSEVELITCGLPSSEYYYNFIVSEVVSAGLTPPYDYGCTTFEVDDSPLQIVVDTREQTPLNFKDVTIVKNSLNFGDYAVLGKEQGIVIERKSLPDLIGSCVAQYERFTREFQRAKDAGAYLIVLCEESLNTAQNYPYIPYLRRFIKTPPEAVFHNVRELMQNFGFQFVFCDGRARAAEVAIKIFRLKQDVRTLDLQFYLDRRKLL